MMTVSILKKSSSNTTINTLHWFLLFVVVLSLCLNFPRKRLSWSRRLQRLTMTRSMRRHSHSMNTPLITFFTPLNVSRPTSTDVFWPVARLWEYKFKRLKSCYACAHASECEALKNGIPNESLCIFLHTYVHVHVAI